MQKCVFSLGDVAAGRDGVFPRRFLASGGMPEARTDCATRTFREAQARCRIELADLRGCDATFCWRCEWQVKPSELELLGSSGGPEGDSELPVESVCFVN